MKPQVFFIPAAVAALSALIAFGPSTASPATAATPPPTPPPVDAPAPAATPTPFAPPNGPQFPTAASPIPYGSVTPSPTPPPNARKGLEGVWEIQIQRPNSTDYTHIKLAQTGNALTGTYLDRSGKRYPLAGSVDGQAIRMIVTLPDGTTLLMEGRLDGTTDMLGMLTTSKEQVPFTAAYRPKEKWIDNVNPAPGGMGAPSSGGSGAGPYNPPR